MSKEVEFVEKTNGVHEVFLEKLRLPGAPDREFSNWLSSAALNLCVILQDAELKDKLLHADELVKVVEEGFERKDLLEDLSGEERDRMMYSKALFTKIFKEKPDERKTIEASIASVSTESEEEVVQESTAAKKTKVMMGGYEEPICDICRQSFKRPKILPCDHVFCLHCLEETVSSTNKNPGDKMPCGRCEQEFIIPKEGFEGLENFVAARKEIKPVDVPESSSTCNICEACAEDSDVDDVTEIPPAVVYCVDCNKKLCTVCCRYHKKLLKSHKVQGLEDPWNVSAAFARLTIKRKTDELPEKYQRDPVLLKTIATKAAEEERKQIRGLTILNKELFVVTAKSSDVEVYDSIIFSYGRRWRLEKLTDPLDIGSCNIHECLYILDSKGQSFEILRVDPNGILIKKWSMGNDCGKSLSVTHESTIILTLYEKSKLHEYSPDGQLICEIILPDEISNPLHAIKLTNGDFLVSHGFHRGDQHRVCIVDANKKLKKSFGRESGKTIEQLECPLHLAVDRSGFVMVVDQRNARVLLLDSNLQFKREIISKRKHKCHWISRILLDESNGHLLVTENWGRGWISIFSWHD